MRRSKRWPLLPDVEIARVHDLAKPGRLALVNWGVIGPGAIAHNFANGLDQTDTGRLVAIAGRDPTRAADFGKKFSVSGNKIYQDYKALLSDPDVSAVYIATPHPIHAEIAIAALNAGKHVLVEKPAGMNADQVSAIVAVSDRQALFFLEGYMYLCHPQIGRVITCIGTGRIGDVRHIRASFGWGGTIDPTSRVFDPKLGGGAIWDIGGYPVSMARLIAGVALGKQYAEPVLIEGHGSLAATGVDETAHAKLQFDQGITADLSVSVTQKLENNVVITGDKGHIVIHNPWTPGRNQGPSDASFSIVDRQGNETIEWLRDPRQLFAFQAEAANLAITAGHKCAAFPAMNGAQSIAQNAVMDAWRAQVGGAPIPEARA